MINPSQPCRSFSVEKTSRMMSGSGGDMGYGFHNNGEGSARPGGCKAPAMGRGGRCPAFRRADGLITDAPICQRSFYSAQAIRGRR